MKILAADTSTKIISVAILDGEDTEARIHQQFSRSQGSSLIPTIQRLLEEINCEMTEIQLFCVGLGPGSFTGLRTSLAAMRTLSITLKKPIIGISSFDVIAYNIAQSDDICVLFDARQNKVYARFYQRKNDKVESTSGFLLDELQNILGMVNNNTVITGDAVKVYGSEILKRKKDFVSFAAEDLWYPKADTLARLAKDKYEKGYRDDPFSLLPLYIYPKECQVKKVQS